MAKPLSILFVSSECVPYAKETGVADVSYSLPLALRESGHDVRVVIPKYGCISERRNKIHEISRLRDIEIPFNDGLELTTIKSSSILNSRTKVQAYIVTNRHFFDDRRGIFHDPVTWELYDDNCERFMFYAVAVVETCLLLGWIPDIIHCNDWQTAFLPGLIREVFNKKFKKTKIIFTIHNFYHQGVFSLDKLKNSPLPPEAQANYRHKYKFNFMKGGIYYSDYVTTVSPNYASEILKDTKYGNGLDALLKEKKADFKGILNGLDTGKWNPKKDKHVAHKLDGDVKKYKMQNKVAVAKAFGLTLEPGKPLLAMIVRIGTQKGVELFLESAELIFGEKIQMVILGQGDDQDLKEKLVETAKKYPSQLKVKICYDEDLAHLIEAGADMFLMPSLYEPCGLNAMYSITYGTVPIVRETGGLANIVTEHNGNLGNGFLFKKYTPESLHKALVKAIALYNNKEEWLSFIERIMEEDHTWNGKVDDYVEIYKNLKK